MQNVFAEKGFLALATVWTIKGYIKGYLNFEDGFLPYDTISINFMMKSENFQNRYSVFYSFNKFTIQHRTFGKNKSTTTEK